MKGIAIVLVVAVLGILAWVLLHSSHHIAVVVNGHPLVGPAKLAAEGWGLLVGIVALFCAAILLVFVLAGTALILLGALVFAGFVASWFVFPFLLPLLAPLFLVWIFVAAERESSAVRGLGAGIGPKPAFRTDGLAFRKPDVATGSVRARK